MDDLIAAAPLWLPAAIAMAVMVLASGFFSASETALFYLSRDELRAMQVGRPRDRLAATLLRDSERLLTAILFWNLLVNLSYFAVSVVAARRLVEAGHSGFAGLLGFVSVTVIIIFGEVIPKSLAVVFRRSIATLVAWPLAFAVRLVDPVAPVFAGSVRILRRTIFPHLKTEPHLDADDLERAIEASDADAALIRHEQLVLHNILDLSEMTAEEIMRPRGTYTVWSAPLHVADLRSRLAETDYLLLRDEAPDSIAAAVPLNTMSEISDRHLESAAEPVLHVPWCAHLSEMLETMRSELTSVAAVVNEYGETIGIVTYEDVLDTVFAPQPSRAKRVLRREPVLEVAPGRFHVDGLTTLRYLAKRLKVDYEPDDDAQLTVAGLLNESLERFPVVGDECPFLGWQMKVIDAGQRGKVRVMVARTDAQTEAPS